MCGKVFPNSSGDALVFLDKHRTQFLCKPGENNPTWRPDGDLSLAKHQTEAGVAAILEFKEPAAPQPTEASDAMRQLASYLDSVMYHQRERRFVYGIMTNGEWLHVLMAVRMPGQPPRGQFLHWNYFLWTRGFGDGFVIKWLLSQSPAQLGCAAPQKVSVGGVECQLDADHFLGAGQHCVAYGVDHDPKLVVKVYHDPTKATDERKVLRDIAQAGIPNTTRLAASQVDDRDPLAARCVVITPRGHPFDSAHPMTGAHINGLTDAVDALHDAGYVHRDILPVNIFWENANRAILNDWSGATNEFRLKPEFAAFKAADRQALSLAFQRVGVNRIAAMDCTLSPPLRRPRGEVV